MTNFISLAAPSVQSLTPYQPGKPMSELERELGLSNIVKLASNENPLGPGAMAQQAMQTALADVALYPDGNGFALKQAISRKLDVDMARLTLGNGSNDVLDLIARAYLGPGREAVFSQYAFAVYPLSTTAVGGICKVAPAKDYAHDLGAMADLIGPDTRVVFIANPNNPTGTWLTEAALDAFIAEVPNDVLVVVDEAYFEYVEEEQYPNTVQWIERYPNLIVTRTFSKAHALAGLRIGYGLSHPDVADMLNRVRQPFNANLIALAAAEASLADQAHLQKTVELNRVQRQSLSEGITALGLGFIPSVGNFLSVDMGREAGSIDQALLQEGVIVRPLANYGMPNHLRITVGLADQNARLLTALRKVL